MTNYKFILNQEILTSFVEWLPELENGECYYLTALARNKYVRDLKHIQVKIPGDKQQIARFLCHKKNFINRIKELECEQGTYKVKGGIDSVPQESLAFYVSVNPRSQMEGAKESLKMIADLITKPYNGFQLDHEVLTCIQQACSRKIFMDIDFDDVDLNQTLNEAKKHINSNCLTALKTRGGFHLLVKVSEIEPQYKKSWYNQLVKLPGSDVRGDNLIPIPGCCQGMFCPTLEKVL